MRHFVPVLWLALLLCLGVRGIVRDDVRYAWGMFPYVLNYRVEYRWRLANGETVPYAPGKEIRRVKKVFQPKRTHPYGYGLGALRTELRAYAEIVVATKPVPKEATAFEVLLRSRKHASTETPEEEILMRRLSSSP